MGFMCGCVSHKAPVDEDNIQKLGWSLAESGATAAKIIPDSAALHPGYIGYNSPVFL